MFNSTQYISGLNDLIKNNATQFEQYTQALKVSHIDFYILAGLIILLMIIIGCTTTYAKGRKTLLFSQANYQLLFAFITLLIILYIVLIIYFPIISYWINNLVTT